MKKVLYISSFHNEYNPKVFIQKRKTAVVKQLERDDLEVDFIYNSAGDYPLDIKNGTNHYSKLNFSETFKNQPGFFEKIHHKLIKYGLIYPLIVYRLLFLLKKIDLESYDRIIVEGWLPVYVLSFYNLDNIYIRIYGTSVSSEIFEKASIKNSVNPLYQKIKYAVNSKRVRKIIFNSTGSRSRDLFEALKEDRNIGPKPIYLDMPNDIFDDVKISSNKKSQGPLRLLSVSRIEANKGFLQFVDVVKKLNENGTETTLDIIGKGSLMDEVRRYINDEGMEDRVFLRGYMTLDELKKYYQNSDILINSYGFNPLIEALNCGTFVISREFGEVGRILKKNFNSNVYRICLPDNPNIILTEGQEEQFKKELYDNIVWYKNNKNTIEEEDFIPKKSITVADFAENFKEYYDLDIN